MQMNLFEQKAKEINEAEKLEADREEQAGLDALAQLQQNFESTIQENYKSDREFVQSHSRGTECPYCEKKREQVNCAMSIDDEFDYSCVVCNLEYLQWKSKDVKAEYKNEKLIRRYKEALKSDEINSDVNWRPFLKTITERSEIYARNNTGE